MTPRPYQQAAIDAILAAFASGTRRGLVQMPTGCGKTNVFLWLVQEMMRRGEVSSARPAVIVAHREELLQQPLDRITQMDPMLRVGVERAGSRAPAGSEIILASVASVGRDNGRLANVTPGIVIIDEAHHAAAESYHRAMRKWHVLEPGGPCLLGVTATPKRLDRQALYDHGQAVFQHMVYAYPIDQAMRDGWLCPVRGYRVRTNVDLDTVRTVAGDFVDRDLSERLNTQERTRVAITRWGEVASGRKTIVFCVDVAHAQDTRRQWAEETGYPVLCVHGSMHPDERRDVMGTFRAAPDAVLTNVDIATEGFDVPDIGCVVMLRPTKSSARYVQCVGRGLRILADKPDCIVLDVVDNTKRHSLVALPSILDLPPTIDLEGNTLEEARDKLDALQERAGGLGLAAIAAGPPRTLRDLDTLLEQVDLLGLPVPDEVQAVSKLRWLPTGEDAYVLNLPGRRVARCWMDATGIWHGGLRGPNLHACTADRRLGIDMAEAFARTELAVHRVWGNYAFVVDKRAAWTRGAPSDKQLALLRKLSVDPTIIGSVRTKGEASDIIDRYLHRTGTGRRP